MRFTLHALMTLAVTVQASAEGPKLSLPKFLRAKPASATTIDTKPSIDERLLFQPTRFPKGDWDHIPAKVSEVTFSSEDETPLHGLYTQADKPVATILFCHGNGGNVSYYGTWLAEMRVRQRVSILIFDYRGYGKSGGRPTVEGVLADAGAAREKLAELSGVSTDEIVIWGHSMGGAVAVQLAAIEKPRGLILESTFSSFREVAHHHQPALSWIVPKARLNSEDTISTVRCPVLQGHGTADRVVPYELGERLYAAVPGPKKFVKFEGLDHSDIAPVEFGHEIKAFLQSLPAP